MGQSNKRTKNNPKTSLAIWLQMRQILDFSRSDSVHFGSPSQNVLKLILKSPRSVPFGANLTHLGSILYSPAYRVGTEGRVYDTALWTSSFWRGTIHDVITGPRTRRFRGTPPVGCVESGLNPITQGRNLHKIIEGA